MRVRTAEDEPGSERNAVTPVIVGLDGGYVRSRHRAAAIYSLIVTARLNDVDPRAWLADTLRRIADHPAQKLHELLPWNYEPAATTQRAAA